MIAQIICICLLALIVVLSIIIIYRQHKLKQLQKQNQAIDYVIKRMKANMNTKEDIKRLDDIINIVKGSC